LGGVAVDGVVEPVVGPEDGGAEPLGERVVSATDVHVACAVALGWYGVSVEPMPLVTTTEHDVLRFHRAPAGRLLPAPGGCWSTPM
jgi:hypothetical protein